MGLFPWDDKEHMSKMARRLYVEAYRKQKLPDGIGELLSSYEQAYPHIDPRVLVPLARAGYKPNDPVVQKIAALESRHKAGGIWGGVGDVIGGAKRVAGTGVGAVAHQVDRGLGGVDEAVARVAKPAVRTAFVAMETGQQAVNNFVRTQLYTEAHFLEDLRKGGPGAVVNRATQGLALQSTSGTAALSQLVSGHGDDIDLGSGYMPGGAIEKSVRESAGRLEGDAFGVHFGGKDGIAFTPGRVLAATIYEPGTAEFNALSGITDAGVSWNTDPVAGLGHFAKTGELLPRVGRATETLLDTKSIGTAVRELRVKPTLANIVDDTFQGRALDAAVGRIPGHRPTFIPDVAEDWVLKGGNGVVQAFTEHTDPLEMWYASKKKLTIEQLKKLAPTTTDQETKDALLSIVGAQTAFTPQFLGVKARRMNRQGVRMAGMMPGASFLATDPDAGLVHLERTLRNMRVSPEVRNAGLRKWIEESGDPALAVTLTRDILADAADDMAAHLHVRVKDVKREAGETHEAFKARKAAAVDEGRNSRARELIQMFYKNTDEMRMYSGDEIIANERTLGIINGHESIPAQSPFLPSEFTTAMVALPDAREIRHAVSRLNRLVDHPFFKDTEGVLDSLTARWKQMKVLKPNIGLRVVGEQQGRAAAAGLPSIFGHPLDLVASLIGDPKNAKRFMLGKHRQNDIVGMPFFSKESEAGLIQMADGLSGKIDELAGQMGATGRHYRPIEQGQRGFEQAWHNMIVQAAGDPVARKVAEASGNLDTAKRWFTTTPEGMALHARVAEKMPQFAGVAGADAYIDQVWKIVKYRSGEDAKTLEAMATGLFDGRSIGSLNANGKWELDKEFAQHLHKVSPPNVVRGMAAFGEKQKGRADSALASFFDVFMTRPDDFFSRKPILAHHYWTRLEQQMPFMDSATLARAKEMAAREGGADPRMLARMNKITEGSGRITSLDDANFMAKRYALNSIKKELYEASERSQFFDAMRLIFPFGEPWREVVTQWAKIAWANPRVVRRGQQIVYAAQGDPNKGFDFGPDEKGVHHYAGNGFFHKDQYGDEVFNIPFGRNIAKMVAGVPTDLTGFASGMTMMADNLPGTGPVLQVPAALMLPDNKDFDGIRELIFPFAPPDYSAGLLETSAPTWVQRTIGYFKGTDARGYASMVGDVSNYLVSKGDVDMTDPEQVTAMFAKARAIAKRLQLLKGLTAAGAPTSLSPTFLAQVTDGSEDQKQKMVHQWELKNDWQRIVKEYDGDYTLATADFIDRYGQNALLTTQADTYPLVSGLPLSQAASDWERDNPTLVKKYKLTWGLFAPKGESDSFDIRAWQRQKNRGDRLTLTPEQRVDLAQQHQGAQIYAVAKASVGDKPSKQQREALAVIHELIKQNYPGYGHDVAGLPSRADIEQVVKELRRSVADPKLADNDQATAARLYLDARDQAIEAARALGSTAFGGEALGTPAADNLRAALGSIGLLIVKKYPGFKDFYDAVFSREVDSE